LLIGSKLALMPNNFNEMRLGSPIHCRP
jgi:hypothetical protein